ncbi:MAG: hypothetical protein H6Q48_4377, partial [Deltaproteobacteria bacterium]|nr:hypothetical protein [Deltaproteobacteria bacterium]
MGEMEIGLKFLSQAEPILESQAGVRRKVATHQ